jgi:hypothetical protein
MTWFSWAKSNTGSFLPISLRRSTPTGADQRRYSPTNAERIILTGPRQTNLSPKFEQRTSEASHLLYRCSSSFQRQPVSVTYKFDSTLLPEDAANSAAKATLLFFRGVEELQGCDSKTFSA